MELRQGVTYGPVHVDAGPLSRPGLKRRLEHAEDVRRIHRRRRLQALAKLRAIEPQTRFSSTCRLKKSSAGSAKNARAPPGLNATPATDFNAAVSITPDFDCAPITSDAVPLAIRSITI